MFRTSCLSLCFGHRRGKYKAKSTDDPELQLREVKLDPDLKDSRTRHSNSQDTTRTVAPVEVPAIKTSKMYSEPVETIRHREYPNMANGKSRLQG